MNASWRALKSTLAGSSNALSTIFIGYFVQKLFQAEVGQWNGTLGHFTQALKNQKSYFTTNFSEYGEVQQIKII